MKTNKKKKEKLTNHNIHIHHLYYYTCKDDTVTESNSSDIHQYLEFEFKLNL